MKILNLDTTILTDFYCKEIRSILEFGVAVWHSGLSVKNSQQLETIQKVCVNIILKELPCKETYEVKCTLLNLEPLHYRRLDLCKRFIQKASLDPQHEDLFSKTTMNVKTRQSQLIYREFYCRTNRFYNSQLCYLTRLLNNFPVKK